MKISSVNSGLNLRLQKAEQPLNDSNQVEAVRPTRDRLNGGRKEPEAQLQVTTADVESAVDETNQMLRYINERLEFSVHEATNRVMVKVLDRDTDEVLREIPPEQMLDLVAKLQELVGLLVDKKA